MRRPAASRRSIEDKVGVRWADGIEEAPGRVTQVRYFTRDAGRKLPEPPDLNSPRWQRGLNKPQAITGDDPFGPEGETPWQQIAIGTGIAGWDDQSHVSQAVRDSLKAAAGIQVPRARLSSRSWRLHLRARAAQLVGLPVLRAASNWPGCWRP